MSEKKKYDSTVARIAGNLLSGRAVPSWKGDLSNQDKESVIWAVYVARYIVEITQITDPVTPDGTT